MSMHRVWFLELRGTSFGRGLEYSAFFKNEFEWVLFISNIKVFHAMVVEYSFIS